MCVFFWLQGNDSDTDILFILWPNKSSSTSLVSPEALPFSTISDISVVSGRFQHIFLVVIITFSIPMSSSFWLKKLLYFCLNIFLPIQTV